MKQRTIKAFVGDKQPVQIKISAKVGDFKPSSREMTPKGLLCKDAVLAVAPQVREYLPSELGVSDWPNKTIRILTPEDVLFSSLVTDSIEDLVDNHPIGNQVTPQNWRKHTIGVNKSPRRVGDELRGDLLVKDEAAIKAINNGDKVELSLGYEMIASFEAGKTEDGQEYDAVVTKMIGDHVALVQFGRGGKRVRIGDEYKQEKDEMIKLKVNGQEWEVEVANAEAFKAAIEAEQSKLGEAQDKLKGTININGKDFNITEVEAIQAAFVELAKQNSELEKSKKELEETAIKPEDVEKLASERSEVVKEATALNPDLKPEGKTVDAIKTEAVEAHAGDASVTAILKGVKVGDAKPEAIGTAFDVLVATKKGAGTGGNGGKQFGGPTGDSNSSKALGDLNDDDMSEQEIADIKSKAKSQQWKGAK